jgi:hypothetical protein
MSKEKNILEINEINTKTEPKFSKHQLLKSKKYQHQVDALNLLLKDDNQYTIKEVDKLINDFLKRKVTK